MMQKPRSIGHDQPVVLSGPSARIALVAPRPSLPPRGKSLLTAVGTLGIALVMLVPTTEAQVAAGDVCASLSRFELDGFNLEIAGARQVGAGFVGRGGTEPAHCRVDGIIDRRTGTDGATYGIGFALALPDNWNGRFLFQGGGGLNGTVRPPVGNQATGGTSALSRGFAVVSTDTGHTGSGFDGSFRRDQQASLDFLYVAIGRVASLAESVIAEYYERPADYSYFVGCSTGGREAMLMSQRYPTYFDGIVAGAPAIRTGHSNMSLAYINAAFNEFAPRDAAGVPQMSQLFSDNDKQFIMDSLLAACDLQDGLEDGLIFNTRACNRFDPAVLTCQRGQVSACLVESQVSALQKAFTGPIDSLGNQVYPRFPWDSGLNASGGGLPGILQAGGNSPVQAQSTSADFDVDRAAAALVADGMGRAGDSTWTNLSTFRDEGGKLMFYHGMSDPWFSALDTVGYYERMSAANGGMDAVRDWSRVYLVPGMGHCSGGAALDNFDMLTPIMEWVEEGIAPDSVTSTGSAFPGRSRPLCPYPEYARFMGGDPDSAASFECRE